MTGRPVSFRVEWPTLTLLLGCYTVWFLALYWFSALWLPLGMVITIITIALHSSLTHELIHGHPFRSAWLNAALGFPSLGLFVPYLRFQDLHLAHHHDSNLTDPYDDPESNYLDPETWARLPGLAQCLLRANNTLLGRILLGPVLGQLAFMKADWTAIRTSNRPVAIAWALHVPAIAVVLCLVVVSPMPLWAYLACAYAGFGIIKIRTFLEHRAHDRASGRTVVVEGGGLLSFLFLNNNLHVVHHMHPQVAWYDLPALWRGKKEHYLRRNEGYYYGSYSEIFRSHLLRAKDPVPHPLRPQSDWPAE